MLLLAAKADDAVADEDVAKLELRVAHATACNPAQLCRLFQDLCDLARRLWADAETCDDPDIGTLFNIAGQLCREEAVKEAQRREGMRQSRMRL